jgi:hypothetical protein
MTVERGLKAQFLFPCLACFVRRAKVHVPALVLVLARAPPSRISFRVSVRMPAASPLQKEYLQQHGGIKRKKRRRRSKIMQIMR